MANLYRTNCAWQNFPGAPGVTTFYSSNSPDQSEVDALRTFFQAFAAMLPTGLTIQVPNTGDQINDADGSILGAWGGVTQPAVVTGTSAAAYAGNAGAVIHWLTTGIVNSRRVRGRSFLVPITSTSFDAQGSLSAASITTLTNAATTLLANFPVMSVWARPFAGSPTDPTPRNGSQHLVSSIRVPDLSVSLRSRRT